MDETPTAEPSPSPTTSPTTSPEPSSPTGTASPEPSPTATVTETVTATPEPSPEPPSCGTSRAEACHVRLDTEAQTFVPVWLGLALVLLFLAALLAAQLRRP